MSVLRAAPLCPCQPSLCCDSQLHSCPEAVQICLIFGHLWSTNDTLLRRRLLLLLHQKGAILGTVRAHLDSLYADISDGDDPDKVCAVVDHG